MAFSNKRTILIFFCLMLLSLVSCNNNDDESASSEIEETGQQIGDVMTSIDEFGGNNGTLTIAATCAASSTFGACTVNTITRTFGGCTIGTATVDGTVALIWGGSSTNCTMQGINDYVDRVPAFTMTGRRGAILTVSKTGTVGQRLKWVSGSGANKVFAFSNDGIRRVFVSTTGATTFDYTTETTADITVTGTSRSNRVVSGGSLRVTNNSSSVSCDYVPTAVTWNRTTCNCPVSGSWAGTCSDGKTSTVTHTGCGSARIDVGGETQNFTFDRCYGT